MSLLSNSSSLLKSIREELLVFYDKFGGFNEFIHKDTDREQFLKLLLAGKERNLNSNIAKNELPEQTFTSPNNEFVG